MSMNLVFFYVRNENKNLNQIIHSIGQSWFEWTKFRNVLCTLLSSHQIVRTSIFVKVIFEMTNRANHKTFQVSASVVITNDNVFAILHHNTENDVISLEMVTTLLLYATEHQNTQLFGCYPILIYFFCVIRQQNECSSNVSTC